MTIISSAASLAGLELKNRIIMAPMGPHFGDINRKATEYFVRRAEGGAAMIMINMMVTDHFEDTSASLVLREENLEYLREICERSHQFGCRVCLQLMPGNGRMSGASKLYKVPICASAVPWLYAPKLKCHELTQEEIDLLLSETERTVRLAERAGVDAYEMHAYGGYLNDQFLTAAWNKRKDKYGGDVKGRATFLLEQIAAVRRNSKAPVIVKFCPEHLVELPGLRHIEEGIELAKYLEESGVDALHVDVGCYEKWVYAMPALFYQETVKQIEAAKAIRENVSIPVMTHGRLANPDKAEAALKNGFIDYAVIGRGLLADPDLPNKLKDGCCEDIRPCISCNEGCIGNVYRNEQLSCALNPFTGYESERSIVKTDAPKKVLVVGAGPGGCAAALMAKQAGHDVELWEKTSSVGGKTLAASAPFMKADMIRLPQYYMTQLVKQGVKLRFFKEADRENLEAAKPDVLIWAAGGRAVRPASIPGINGRNVFTCESALRNQVPLGHSLAIIGGGQVGVEAAVHFERMGHEVTIIEMAAKLMPEPPFAQNDSILRDMVADSGIKVLTKTKLTAIDEGGITVENKNGAQHIECGTVLLAMGWAPDAETGKEFSDICTVLTVGDSNRCRNIYKATHEAYEAVKNI